MVRHYIKVAIRNFLAHKMQALVSLLGLAVAFSCVSLATYWNYYERTYDSFQEHADCIYRIRCKDWANGVEEPMSGTPYPLHIYLKEQYPEVEEACAIGGGMPYKISMDGMIFPRDVFARVITLGVLDIFDFEWLEGNKNVMTYQECQIAISDELAKGLYQDSSPLGQIMEDLYTKIKYEVVGVYKARPKHSNLKFDVIAPLHETEFTTWSGYGYRTYVLLKEKVDHTHFIQKLQKDTIKQKGTSKRVFDVITPLKTLRQYYPDEEINVDLKDVDLFTMASLLLSFCALFNYLILFVSQLRARGRDMALRTICGSSTWQTSGLLLTEYLLLLISASFVGMLFVELAMREFVELAMIQIAFSSVMISCGWLMLFSVVLSVILSIVPILYFKRKTLLVQIKAIPIRLGKNYFRSIGVCVQLIVGILFIFSSAVMIKQIYMLTNVDNIERKQIAWINLYGKSESNIVDGILQQQPYISKILHCTKPLYPSKKIVLNKIKSWDGKSAEQSEVEYSSFPITHEIAQFYGLRMKEGDSSFELGENEVLINETLARRMNMDSPVGRSIELRNMYKIKGVICDFQTQDPNTPVVPMLFTPPLKDARFAPRYIAFKYEGKWNTCKKRLEEELKKKEVFHYQLADGEEFYQQYIKSEYNLLKLLGVITVVSILIAIFGVYALIMQSCDQHRKEIAIRKVHGAGVMDILMMFFKQYMMQVVMAAVIAFPIGYVLMKNWLEQYARQTSISLWIYLSIFLGISLLVTLCIGWRVWKAANENPAWVIKKE